eukprot:g25.t1
MKEVKKTAYKVKATILASREQQCCNPELKDSHGTSRNNACVKMIKAKRCPWHQRLEEYDNVPILQSHASRVLDIEDLSTLGGRSGPCAYFFSRRMAEVADLVFMPYNYLVEKQTRDGLKSMFDWSGAIVIFDEAHNIEAFRVFVKREENKSGMRKTTLSYWCFSPGIAMRSFVESCQIQSVILTSGTLSPMNSFASELKLTFPIQLENEHIVTKEQVLIGCVSAGPTGTVLDSSYNHRNDPKYKEDLGLAVVQFLRAIPGGVLMFFPSYSVLQSSIEYWKNCNRNGVTLWQKITQLKGVEVEPQSPTLLPNTMKSFRQKLGQSVIKGCVLFAVCRGKVSEGIDFSDDAARGVIIAGIPYAPPTDPKVRLKREFLNGDRSGLTGGKWYSQSATRAVNQALGRVIRHREDYGVILLCDRRFGDKGTQTQLSKWIRNSINHYNSFGCVIRDLKNFFQSPKRSEISQNKCKRIESMNCRMTKVDLVTSSVWKRSAIMEKEEVGVSSAKKRQKKEKSVVELVDLSLRVDTTHTIIDKQVSNKTNQRADLEVEKATLHEDSDVKITEQSINLEPVNDITLVESEVTLSQDPREFMTQVKSALSEKIYTELRRLLSELKSTLDMDGFQESLVQLLSGEDTHQLLPGFASFFPENRRKTFLERIKRATNKS